MYLIKEKGNSRGTWKPISNLKGISNSRMIKNYLKKEYPDMDKLKKGDDCHVWDTKGKATEGYWYAAKIEKVRLFILNACSI